MSNSAKQKDEELSVFKTFMRVCEYKIITGSIVLQDPPKPDIFCKLETGVSIEFELTNAVDSGVAQKMNDKKIIDKGGFCGEPIESVILDKNRKLKEGKYEVGADHIELLVYMGCMPLFPHFKRTIPDFLERNKAEWVFNRIWIFQENQLASRILWSYPK